jgi:uncharacterized protein
MGDVVDALMVFVAAGLAAGFLSGLIGIGGGLVIVPVLAAVFSAQHVSDAVLMPLTMGTSLATIAFTSVSSVRAHASRGAVDWALVRKMAPALAFGAGCGAFTSTHLSCVVLKSAFVLFALFAAGQLVLGSEASAERRLPGRAGLGAAAGGFGLIAGLVGTGAATMTVPFLTWCSVPLRTAIGSASAFAFPIALGGSLAYIVSGLSASDLPPHSAGYIHLPALFSLVLASVIAAPFGAATSHRMPPALLKKVFALGVCIAAVKMLTAM